MATYSGIKGFTIQSLATDPYASPIASGAWASGGNLTTGRDGGAGFGNPAATTAMVAGGWVSPGVTYTVNTESYDGTSWTEVNNLTGTATGGAGSTGTATAGVYFGGLPPSPGPTNITQEFDGTSWAAGGNLNTSRRDISSGGIQTAAFAALGAIDPPFSNAAETYNGTAWTTVNSCNTARRTGTGAGTVTAGLAYGGYISPAYSANAEAYDGTSWSEEADMNKLAGNLVGTHSGTNTAALAVGGYGGPPGSQRFATNEYYDGTTWTELADISTTRSTSAGGGISTDAFIASGYTDSATPYALTSEFWSLADPLTLAQEGQVWYNTTSTVLKGFGKQGTLSWSSGGNLNTARRQLEAAGSGSTSAIAFSGRTSGPIATNVSETYDGTTWTEGNDILTARYTGTGFGVETAAICATGKTAPTTYVTNSEIYDGTSWTAGNPVLSGRGYLAGCGTTTSGLAIGGYDGARLEIVEEFDGTSWSEVGDLQTANDNSLMAAVQGTAAAALAFGGYPTPATRTESYNGSTWTEVNDLNQGRSNGQGSGTATAALAIGGAPPNAGLANVEVWDGTSWTETSYDLGSGRYYGAAAGSSTNAIGMGGYNIAAAPAYALNTSEELEAASTTKTFTAT